LQSQENITWLMPHINQKVGLLQPEITNFAQQWTIAPALLYLIQNEEILKKYHLFKINFFEFLSQFLVNKNLPYL